MWVTCAQMWVTCAGAGTDLERRAVQQVQGSAAEGHCGKAERERSQRKVATKDRNERSQRKVVSHTHTVCAPAAGRSVCAPVSHLYSHPAVLKHRRMDAACVCVRVCVCVCDGETCQRVRCRDAPE
eukprot:309139-Rhodomonas_salina.1